MSQGAVSIGGCSVSDISLFELRKSIGYVSQDPFLFDATVQENLLLANENASEEELQSALTSAQASDFVNALPQGLNTLIGERGIRLSMGEKQRLTLARAILKPSPLLILDEATASVDVKTESKYKEHSIN